jgi:hypothetical protein
MVGMVGVEPTRPFGHTILSRARLPVPPHTLRLLLDFILPILFFANSGCRELNPVYLLPKQVYYRYTTPRICKERFGFGNPLPRARIELATQGFSVLRSTTELPRQWGAKLFVASIFSLCLCLSAPGGGYLGFAEGQY